VERERFKGATHYSEKKAGANHFQVPCSIPETEHACLPIGGHSTGSRLLGHSITRGSVMYSDRRGSPTHLEPKGTVTVVTTGTIVP